LTTLFGLTRRGYFIPYRYATRAAGSGPTYAAAAAILAREAKIFAGIMADVNALRDALNRIGQAGDTGATRARWNQDWFAPLDAAVAYTLVRTRRPRRIVEIGSGHSTRFFLRAIRDAQLATHLTAIDPEPRADLSMSGVDICRTTIQEIGTAPFAPLAAGDFVVIDSSHVLMPGSDVDILVNTILPMLPAGAHIHFHDIFLPDDYPANWRWRAYNEQSAVSALLLSGAYTPIFASHYVATRMESLVKHGVVAGLLRLNSARDSSLWLVKRSDAILPS
jgi:hypothetical protein